MDGPMTTWRKELIRAMSANVDAGPVIAYAPDEAAFDVEFDDGYGAAEGKPVLAWTRDYVYFPVTYDGSEWIGSAPRNPTAKGQVHVGG